MTDNVKVLVTGVITSKKNNKHYATMRVWNGYWTDNLNSDGSRSDYMVEVSSDVKDALERDLEEGIVAECETEQKGLKVVPTKLIY